MARTFDVIPQGDPAINDYPTQGLTFATGYGLVVPRKYSIPAGVVITLQAQAYLRIA